MVSAQVLNQLLVEYEQSSGQCVNFKKSSIFFNVNVDVTIIHNITDSLGVRISSEPEHDLGLPNMVGHNRRHAV